ncbi:MAG: HD domain-containing protein [Bacillota bacterium]
MILQKHGLSQEVVAAGLLHDILEDAEMTEQELKEIFNEDILELVKGASEKLENRDDTCWKDRKCHTIKYLKNAKKEIQYFLLISILYHNTNGESGIKPKDEQK